MNLFQRISSTWIIHIFAFLHLSTALCCRLSGVDDELFLTMLTMAMTLIVCLKKNLSIEFTASMIIVGNIIGYLLGTMGAHILGSAFTSPYIIQPLSTFITTELLGWGIVAIANLFKLGKTDKDKRVLSSSYTKWLLLAAGIIFILRIGVVLIFSQVSVDSESIYGIIQDILSNSVGLLILICLNILYIRYSDKKFSKTSRPKRTIILSFFTIASGLIEALIIGFGFPFTIFSGFNGNFTLVFTLSLLTEITIYCIIFIINYALTARRDMQTQRERAHTAQYRYMKLKGQVNPHFLFNSLNILDCLVCEEKTEQASVYIHKLAGIYRYMIKSEDEQLVPLEDELMFVEKYVDLMKVRFPEGLRVEIDIPSGLMSRYILPCSIQLLIENAAKHNVISAANPLVVSICSDGESISVTNNIIPKVTQVSSTGLGQKYIRQQYQNLCGKEIAISLNAEEYKVVLPLI